MPPAPHAKAALDQTRNGKEKKNDAPTVEHLRESWGMDHQPAQQRWQHDSQYMQQQQHCAHTERDDEQDEGEVLHLQSGNLETILDTYPYIALALLDDSPRSIVLSALWTRAASSLASTHGTRVQFAKVILHREEGVRDWLHAYEVRQRNHDHGGGRRRW
jgi:hypothetical protein